MKVPTNRRPTGTLGPGASRWLLAACDDADRIAVGRAYLAISATERTAADLARELEPSAAPDLESFALDLRARIGADFRAGRTVVVNGWILARTEARFCALAALLTVPPASRQPPS